jgi:adenosylcobinamide-phosphate synthase
VELSLLSPGLLNPGLLNPGILKPNAWFLVAAVLLDFAIGDPVYAAHPVRLMGRTLTFFENRLRVMRADGYAGGIALFLLLACVWIGGVSGVTLAIERVSHSAAIAAHVFWVYSFVALHDLFRHVWRVERATARGDLNAARTAIGQLVGRDTSQLEAAACRRAAIESLSENLSDGFVSPLFWYAIAGLPGIVLFKIASTMDSMVGYKTPRYLEFGWCGARLDDVMNFVPARITWLLLAAVAIFVPGCSAKKAMLVGWRQHAILPGPNAGWGEAATAGAIQRKLIGPIWKNGVLVTDIWLGDSDDAAAGESVDVKRASVLIGITGVLAAVLVVLALAHEGAPR